MKTLGILLLLVPFTSAAKSFTFNDDLVCAYPFEDFQIQSMTCGKPSFISILGDNYDDGVCSFSDLMDISGKVTISQAVFHTYYIVLDACFRTGDATWYASKKCMSFRTSLDLLASSSTSNANGGNDANNGNAVATQAPYITYLEAGTYDWKARLLLPKKCRVLLNRRDL